MIIILSSIGSSIFFRPRFNTIKCNCKLKNIKDVAMISYMYTFNDDDFIDGHVPTTSFNGK